MFADIGYPLHELAKRYAPSHLAVAIIAARLQMDEFGVYLPVQRLRKPNEDRKKFETSTDMVVFLDLQSRKRVSIEVKGRNLSFCSTPESFPFDEVLMCAANKRSDPDAIAIYSNDAHSMLFAINDGSWFKKDQVDNDPNRNGLTYPAYYADRSKLMKYSDFKAWLHQRLTTV